MPYGGPVAGLMLLYGGLWLVVVVVVVVARHAGAGKDRPAHGSHRPGAEPGPVALTPLG
jgi:hypothetical protein